LTDFSKLAELCEELESLSSRNEKITIVSQFLKKLDPSEMEAAVRLILSNPLASLGTRPLDVSFKTIVESIQRLTEVSDAKFMETFNKSGDVGAAVKTLLEEMPRNKQQVIFQKPLTILEVYKYFEAVAESVGFGSRIKKRQIIESLLSRATPLEAKYIVKNFIFEMRLGFREGLMEEAIASASNVPSNLVRRADLLVSDLGSVAKVAMEHGVSELEKLKVTLFHPIRPMLAEPVASIEEALSEHEGRTCFEFKPDGARVQIHKDGDKVKIFSRRLSDVTASLPEIVETIKKELKADKAIVEGEVIAVSMEGRPRPFQYLMRRFRRIREVKEKKLEVPVVLEVFDILYLDDQTLLDTPYVERRNILRRIAGKISLTRELITSSLQLGESFFEEALSSGYEGLVAKQLDSAYLPGTRGKKWLKIKRALDTLDLVVVAAEYGYGYRHAWLSDYYLAAKDEETGKLEIVGKCFTGLTDEEIQDTSKRLMESKISAKGRTVIVQPKIVLEIAFSEIQKSPNYSSGFALRFSRILRIRDDKSPTDADSIRRIREIYLRQFEKKSF